METNNTAAKIFTFQSQISENHTFISILPPLIRSNYASIGERLTKYACFFKNLNQLLKHDDHSHFFRLMLNAGKAVSG